MQRLIKNEEQEMKENKTFTLVSDSVGIEAGEMLLSSRLTASSINRGDGAYKLKHENLHFY